MAIEMPPDVEQSAFCICHHNLERARVSSDTLRQAQDCNYDSLTVPITTYAFHARVQSLISNHLYSCVPSDHTTDTTPTIPPLSSPDTHLEPAEHVRHLLGVIGPWIDLTSPDPSIYDVSCQVLDMEVDFAAFCGLRALLLPAPRLRYGSDVGQGVTQYARAVSEAIRAAPQIDFSITMPMMDDPHSFEESETNLSRLARPDYSSSADSRRPSIDSTAVKHDFFGTWDAWNMIRAFCGYNPHLFVGLAIPPKLPPSSICSRWHSEPLQVLLIDSTTFCTNPSNYPVLTANHRALISQYMKLRNPSGNGLIPPIILFTGIDPIPGNPYTIFGETNGSTDPDVTMGSSSLSVNPTPSEAYAVEAGSRFGNGKHTSREKSLAHLTYLRWFQQHQPPRTDFERQTAAWQEFLQVPLNPLADNLDSTTYEVFEQDPIKYDRYEEAIRKALLDWQQEGKKSSGLHDRVVVAVVGAGRGPLVERARKASAATGVAIELWALEKNPNAWILLQRHNADRWHGQVHLVKSDMRSWKGPARDMENETSNGYQPPNHSHNSLNNYPIDIAVSELLGSLGDNELSPECLDPIMPLLNPTHGISIPQSYSAHLTPIAAPKLHAKILADSKYDASAPNIPYVVYLHSFDYLSTTSHLSAYGPDHTPVPRASTQQPSSSHHRATATTASSTAPSLFAAITPEEEGIHIWKTPAPLVQEAWSFHHHPPPPSSSSPSSTPPLTTLPASSSPSTIPNIHNARHARLSFPLRHRAACHGLAGYFEATLYGDVGLSTNPLTMPTMSPDMMSWFPIFFPLQRPLYTPDQSKLVVEIWRVCKAGKVWYEWVVEAWCKGVRVGVSEVGRSRDKGMLL